MMQGKNMVTIQSAIIIADRPLFTQNANIFRISNIII